MRKVNNSGFMSYLERRRYKEDQQDNHFLELIVDTLSHACSGGKILRFQAQLDRFIRMLKDCNHFLFEDVPHLIQACITNKQNINLVQLMYNYMYILKTVIRKDFFPCQKVLDVFPTLENYMNRLHEQRLADLEKANDCFMSLKTEVERYEEPENLDEEEEVENLNIKNFRLLSIVPRSRDIVNYEISNVPKNIIDGPYKSVDHYLSVYYRLTREDMLRAFRECVKLHLSTGHRFSDSAINCFERVSVGFPPEYDSKGIFYKIQCKTTKDIDWSKNVLTPGTLVFLTPDSCNSVVFATVQKVPVVQTNKSKECRLTIKLEDDMYNDELKKDLNYEMIEPTAFFESYKHILAAIKDFSEATLPLSDIITYLDFNDTTPQYLPELSEYCLHELCSDRRHPDPECTCKIFNPLKKDEWPSSADLKLDEQQYHAFKLALTNKVAVIQGPPGTGKTYIGVKIVETLIRNVPLKPIIICCLTNHALDQILERLLDFTQKIVRLGSQSKSEKLEPHKLENLIYVIRQYHNEEIDNPATNQSLNIVKKISEVVLKLKLVDVDTGFQTLCDMTREINNNMHLYALLQEKFLDDESLKSIIDSEYKSQLRLKSGTALKLLSTGVLEWLNCSRTSDLYDKCRKKFYDFNRRAIFDYHNVDDIWKLTEQKRYELFYCWRKKCMDIVKHNLQISIEEYRTIQRESNFMTVSPNRIELLKNADIVGITTTGAGKYRDMLKFATPSIVVIEEAAQVLESHVITSLFPTTQHLILIGDHEQLRPLPADNELSEKYNLKISMFERLFLNHAPSATLVMQHRMKPIIAELLVPKPYEKYESYENVYKYEEIRGVGSSVFFFDHRVKEDDKSSGTSSTNDFEAQMIVAFAKYLIFIQYLPENITILATYIAQVICIHNYLKDQNLDKIHVTSVDNFQGEENDIILLSFVRSNPTTIGFLKESNRVCVALSRARKGMFCFGNFQLYSDRNDLWNDIVVKLRDKNIIGDTLPLQCHRHKTVYVAKSAQDICDFLSSGCSEICNFELPCGHLCTRPCHFEDPDHQFYLCKQPCTKIIDENRVCPRLCFERCKKGKKKSFLLPCGHTSSRIDSLCVQEETKRLPCNHLVTVACHIDIDKYPCKAKVNKPLNCGHTKSVWCYEENENRNVICSELKPQIAPCDHTVEVPCSMNFGEDDLVPFCKKACDVLLDCGHPCVRPCRVCFDTGIHGFCGEKCDLILSCGHKCGGYCGSPCPPCEEKCFLSCDHSSSCCINSCLRPCVQCIEPCARKCVHERCTKRCSDNCNASPCTTPCQEVLACGHKCIGLCGDPCPYLCRVCHCSDFKGSDNENNCYVQLQCEHVIELNELNEYINVCLESFQWPCCPQCSSAITKSMRYKEKLKRAKKICIECCETSEEKARVLYLVKCMYGISFVVPAQFIFIDEEISRIMTSEKPRLDSLMVLKHCAVQLKKLVNVVKKLETCDANIQAKFDTLLLWICNHLTQASFQQLRELEEAVSKLTNEIKLCSSSGQRLKEYLSSI